MVFRMAPFLYKMSFATLALNKLVRQNLGISEES
jgi:hypothetical protein